MFPHSPSLDIFGSFFPIWMLCIVAAILLTLAARFVLIRARLDGELGPRVVIYPSMVALFACAIWLVFFDY
jgi:YtcA-like protein